MLLEKKGLGTPVEKLDVCSHLSVALVQSVVLFLHVWFSLLQPSDWETEREETV